MSKTYNKQDSQVKQYSRSRILTHILEKFPTKRALKVLTLCNTNFWLETQLLDLYPGSIINALEIDRSIYLKAEPPDGINLINKDIFTLDKGDYDIVWMDLCSSMNNTTINKILRFIEKDNLSKNSLLIVTFCKGREWNLSYEKFYPDYKYTGIYEHFKQFLPQNTTSSFFEYKCYDQSTHSAPMIVYIFNTQNNKNVTRTNSRPKSRSYSSTKQSSIEKSTV